MLLRKPPFSCCILPTDRFLPSPNLSHPANTIHRHNLTATLETAIRSSNAQRDPPDVLRRLDVRMTEYSHGEIGWDVFTLEYKVDSPVNTVLDADSMMNYLKMFNHLWKMKRIECALSVAWMRTAGGSRTFLRLPGRDFAPGPAERSENLSLLQV